MFSDDAYNKNIYRDAGPTGHGTLIGNWAEERVLREATGEGRSIPQRHIPRSGLLQDFTKTISTVKKGDDTFNRVYGPKSEDEWNPASRTIGAPDKHAGKITHTGPKETVLISGRLDAAENEVLEEEEEVAKEALRRRWDTTTGTYHCKPDETLVEKATYCRQAMIPEILHGPMPERTRCIDNAGLEVSTHTHYTNAEHVTHARTAMGDPRLKSDMKASAASGVNAFGKNSEFTKPVGEFTKGLSKDTELNNMFTGLQDTQPLRHQSGTAPRGPFGDVPSLATVKATLHAKVAQVWGAYGYVALRQRLSDVGDHEGFVHIDAAIAVFRNDLGVVEEEVNSMELDVYLEHLSTMKKTHMKVATVLSSLRPVLGQQYKRQAIELFASLGPSEGVVALGTWLGRVQDPSLKEIVVTAFGAETEEQAANLTLSEPVFLELIADLAPLNDVSSLLV
mmetsp:Transcript_87427/g.182960  ORF Transcript_87427/g.182960 Transcript_87427/m.182960 type:complete len:451 (-) Transcript_87427:91-1443(-)